MKKNLLVLLLIALILPSVALASWWNPFSWFKKVQNDNVELVLPKEDLKCSKNSQWIKLLYPKGGEIFNAGEKLKIKWTSCNISQDKVVGATLVFYSKTAFDAYGFTLGINDGEEEITIPKEPAHVSKRPYDLVEVSLLDREGSAILIIGVPSVHRATCQKGTYCKSGTTYPQDVTKTSFKILGLLKEEKTDKKEIISCPLKEKFFNENCDCPAPWNIRIGNINNGYSCVGMPKDNMDFSKEVKNVDVKTEEKIDKKESNSNTITVIGIFTCLENLPLNAPHTKICIVGLKGEDGFDYRLNYNERFPSMDKMYPKSRIKVIGKFEPNSDDYNNRRELYTLLP
jgi:hypothetical protein